jgi:hypothetical protein
MRQITYSSEGDKMTKKHYNAIAKALQDYQMAMNSMFTEAEPITNTVQDIALILADIFKADNPNFSTDRFLNACGAE